MHNSLSAASSASPLPSPSAPSVPRRMSRLRQVADACLGFIERRRAFPSDRASSEFLSYYEGLYQERGPDPEQFRALMRRNGRPFLANPFPEGTPEHYLYHPDGLVMADLEAVLGGLATDWEKMAATRDGEPLQDADSEDVGLAWPSIQEADQARQLDILETEDRWSRVAGVCWSLVLLQPGSLSWLQNRVHADNLAWATVQALRSSPLEDWDVNPAKVLARAVSQGVLTARVARELFPHWFE